MRQLIYWVYGLCFRFFRLFPIQEQKAVFLSIHNANMKDGLGQVKQAFEETGKGFQFCIIEKQDFLISAPIRLLRCFTSKAYHLATAKYILLNDNFMPLSNLRFHPKAVLTQLWHGTGALKRFGLDIALPPAIQHRIKAAGEKYHYVLASSPNVAEIYASAFGVKQEKVLTLGSPGMDCYFRAEQREALKQQVYAAYPACNGKQLVLYAPTFREDAGADQGLLQVFEPAVFTEVLGEDYLLLLRLHPQIRHAVPHTGNFIDVTDFSDVAALAAACDYLITDYSSIVMDFAVQQKPTVFLAYDLPQYEQQRNFYFPYRSHMPGPIVSTMEEAARAIREQQFALEKIQAFARFHHSDMDGEAATRLVQFLIQRR